MTDITSLREQAQRAVGTGDVNTLGNIVLQLEHAVGAGHDAVIRADVFRYRGTLCSLQADYDGAIAAFDQALAILEPLNNKEMIARIANNMGVVYHTKADYPNALFWYRRSLEAREEYGDLMGVARVSGNIGILYSSLGDNNRAREYYERSLGISIQQNDAEGIGRSTVALGNMHVRIGDLDKAASQLLQGMQQCKKLGLEREYLTAASSLAAVYHQQGKFQEAINLVNTSMPAAITMGLKREELLLSIAHALSSYKLSGEKNTIAALEDLVGQAKALALANEEKDIYKELYSIYKEQHDIHRALLYHEEWVEARDRIATDERQRQLVLLEAEQRLREERQRIEEHQRLLYNMLPAPIAKRLLKGEKEIADSFDNISVLFTDIVGFTHRAANMEVEELLGLLNGLFSQFDQVMRHHGVTKIKTIGDAYMAIAGAPDILDPHEAAKRIANAALELVQLSAGFDIRIGIHTGPAVAGVIGTERMVWDIWGDAVNVAARMEQTSSAGRIQISDQFARILSNHASPILDGTDIVIHAEPFLMRMRGTIEVKGKGEMKTFWLEYMP